MTKHKHNFYEVFNQDKQEVYFECNCGEQKEKEDLTICEGCGEEIQDGQSVIKGENRHAVCS